MSILATNLPDIATQRATETPPVPTDVYALAADFVGHHRAHKARIALYDALVDGRMDTVWPDGSVTQDTPKIAEYVSGDTEDLASLIANPEPTVVVPQLNDEPRNLANAILRQQVIATYRRVNRIRRLRKKTAVDLVGTGLACWVIWPGYGMDPYTSYPRYVRKDPRIVYPDPNLDDPSQLSSLVVRWSTKARLVIAQYPQLQAQLYTSREIQQRAANDENLEVIEYYDPRWCIKVVHRPSKDRRYNSRTITLHAIPNMIRRPLALIAYRETADGKFRGQFDKAIPPLGTANKMMEMHLAQMADMIFAEKIVRGLWDNPEDVGPGATLYTTDYQAQIERATPAGSHPQMFGDLAFLMDQSREAAGIPQGRHGSVDQNIISAQGINALQGKYVTAVEAYQDICSDLEERANSLALAVDEAYMDYPDKWLAGVAGGRSGSTTYTPSIDIAGEYENRVIYGAGAGLDSYNRRVSNIQTMEYRLISRRKAMEQLPEVDDVAAMEAEIVTQDLTDGFIAGLAAPETDLLTRARALAMSTQGKTPVEIAATFAEEAAAAQQSQQAVTEMMGPQQGQMQTGTQEQPSYEQLPPLPVRRV